MTAADALTASIDADVYVGTPEGESYITTGCYVNRNGRRYAEIKLSNHTSISVPADEAINVVRIDY